MTILERFSLRDKVVLLTGGTGYFGRQLTSAIAEAQAQLIIASRNTGRLQEVAEEEAKRGYRVHVETYDQADEQSILALRDRLLNAHGRIDGLVNNSVLRPMKGPDAPLSQWEDSMRVNATGLFLMLRAFGESMAKKQQGSIVNIGSIQGMVGPTPFLYEGTNLGNPPPDYFFHKGGMINLTRYFASMLGARNVRVNCVSPGGFFTGQPEPFLSKYCQKTMLGRMADQNDLGGPIVFLLSDAARYMTGANVAVDGGYTAK
jgi:NAD(P)-dependent dehydrogenase (short-subunit alcohol dehydrogenase family)